MKRKLLHVPKNIGGGESNGGVRKALVGRIEAARITDYHSGKGAEKRDFLRLGDIKQMSDDVEIEVNSNCIYWRLSQLVRRRSGMNTDEIKVLREKIEQINDEKQLYVPMQVKYVKQCFQPIDSMLPRHSFRTYKK